MFSFKLFLLKYIWKQRKTIKNLVNTIEELYADMDRLEDHKKYYKELLYGKWR